MNVTRANENQKRHNCIYASGKLLQETITTTEDATTTTQTLDFFYDANGTPLALKTNNTVYYYVTNLQGDVIQLVDSTGTAVAAYEYDPYGNIVSQSGDFADLNPLRYRGYYYDAETNFYYLQSRYYDPKISRFINADSYASTGQSVIGFNTYSYCLNNPVRYKDSFGSLAVDCFDNDGDLDDEDLIDRKGGNGAPNSGDSRLPTQGTVVGDPKAPPVDAGKQGKHVPGHNHYQANKSSWPAGQTGVQQTQEAWQNGVPDYRKPSQNVRIGIASDGTIVRVHMANDGRIHGYPYYPFFSYCK